MNREILFRGKRKNGEWLLGDLIQRDTKCYIFPDRSINSHDNYEVITETVGQFSGIIDDKGIKIFEGDILKGNYVVEFMSGGFYGVRHHKDNLVNSLKQCSNRLHFEITGNIHDNPELLK